MRLFIPKPKNSSVFSSTARFRSVPYFMKTGNTAKWRKKFDFPEKQGKYPLWYIKLFVYYHWSQITHKNENWGPFVSSGVEKRPWKLKSQKILKVFQFRSTISPEPFLRFRWSFLQTTDNLILFLDKKRKSLKNFKILKKIWNCNFRPKNGKLSILKIFDFFQTFEVFSNFFFFI